MPVENKINNLKGAAPRKVFRYNDNWDRNNKNICLMPRKLRYKVTYNCAKKNNRDGTSNHGCIARQLSVARSCKLQNISIDRILLFNLEI